MKFQPALVGAFFVCAGSLHFAKPRMYEAIVPPGFPNPRALVAISGACEILGGVGTLLPPTRAAAGWGLIALLLAIFPANIFMAIEAKRFRRVAPPWALWARLPLQFVLVWWVYGATQ